MVPGRPWPGLPLGLIQSLDLRQNLPETTVLPVFTGIYMGALLCKCSNHPILVVLVWFEMETVGCRDHESTKSAFFSWK